MEVDIIGMEQRDAVSCVIVVDVRYIGTCILSMDPSLYFVVLLCLVIVCFVPCVL